jgi:hypothetical protein
MSTRKLLVATAALAAVAVAGPVSQASALDQTVSGTTATSLALSVPVTAVFATNFAPGNTASSTLGAITAVNTSPSWTLAAKDGNVVGTAGKMDRAATGCDNSPAELANALSLSVVPAVSNGSITSTTRSLTGSNQTVASASAVPLAATLFNTNYSQTITSSEALEAGCVYSLTTTYTLS